jgi:ankyrin repeat protein
MNITLAGGVSPRLFAYSNQASASTSSSEIFTPSQPISPEDIKRFHRQLHSDVWPESFLRDNSELVNSHHPEDGYTPIIREARNGRADKVKCLLQAGADPLLPETKSMNAIAGHKAAFMGHTEVLRELVSVDDSTAKSMLEVQGPKNGKTVLMDALWIDRPGLPEDYQITPERLPRYVESAELLVSRSKDVGADLELKSHEGISARDMLSDLVPRYPQFQRVLDLF